MRLNEMADSRRKALNDIESTGFSLYEHIMKCVLYRERDDFLVDWYKTIGNLCAYINDKTVKGGALKEEDYLNTLLFFDDVKDCENDIKGFYLREVVTKEKYPSFIDRQNNAEILFNIYFGFVKKISKVFCTKNDYDNRYFARMFEAFFKTKVNLNEDLTNSKLFDLLW